MGVMDDMMAGVAPPPPPEKTFFEKVKESWADVKLEAPQEDFISSQPDGEIATALTNYGTGAIQGAQEQYRQEQALRQIANVDEYGNASPKEGQDPQQVADQQALTTKAQSDFADETIKPPLMPLTLAGTAMSKTVSGILFAPFMAKDIIHSYDKAGGGLEGTKQAGRDLTYGGAVDFINQPDIGEQFVNKPITTTVNGILSILPPLLIGKGLYSAARYKMTKPPTIAEEMGVKPIEKPVETEPTILENVEGETVIPTAEEIISKNIPAPKVAEQVAPNIEGNSIISAGEKQLGKPYSLGADGINSTDCGKFTQDVMSENGINLDYRTADGQYLQFENKGKTFTSESDAQVGDLVFFDVPSNRGTWSASNNPSAVNNSGQAYKGITHVGIYAGEGKVLQAGSHGVSYADINAFGDIVGFAKTGEGKTEGVVGGKLTADEVLKDNTEVVEETNSQVKIDDIANKEPWEMTQEEFKTSSKLAIENEIIFEPIIKNEEFKTSPTKESHGQAIEQAIIENKPVPFKVLAEYPAFVEKYKINVNEQGSLGQSNAIPSESTYTKPVTRAEIVKDINSLVSSRTGRVGNKNFEGIHKIKEEVIRTRNYGDFDTSAHEIGHFIDKKLGIVGHDVELIKAANKEWLGNKIYDKYTPEQKRAEGIAEFGRQYLLNPAESGKNFPNYYKEFTTKLAGDSSVSKPLNVIGEKMRAWYAQSPEARGRGGLSFGYENDKTIIERAKDTGLKAYELMVDDKIGLTRFVNDFEKATGTVLETKNNPEKLARLANNSAMAKSDILVSERNAVEAVKTLNVHYNNALVHDVTFNSIISRISQEVTSKEYPEYLSKGNFKNWNEAFSSYLVARRQIEIQATKADYIGSIGKDDAKHIIDNAPHQFDDIAQDFYNYNDNLMRLRVSEGLTSPAEYAEMKANNQNYAHMARDFEDTSSKAGGNSPGKGFGNIADKLKRLTEEGSTRSVVDPLESAISDTYATLNMVERNRVAQAFVRLSDVNGAGRFVEKVAGNADAKNSIFTVMVDGKKQAYQTESAYYRAIMSMSESTVHPVIQLMSYPAKWLRAGAVLSPEFFIKNPIKDTVEAFIYSKHGFLPIIDTIKGVFSMFKNEEMYNEYKSSGAIMSSFLNSDRATLNTKINDAMKGKSFENPADSVKTLGRTLTSEPLKLPAESMRALVGGLQWLTDISETGSRLGEYMKVKNSGKSIQEAALSAQEITLNFSRSGSLGKSINQVIPFFNAAIQGTDKMAREFYKDPVGVSTKIATLIVTPTIVVALLGINDQEIQELPDYEKDMFWIIRTGDKLLRIPKPLGLNSFANVTEEAIRHMYKQNPRSIQEFTLTTAGSFVPNLIPTAALALTEWATNYSFFREKQIVPQALQHSKPANQFNSFTSETAKLAGSLTNESPMKIDNLITNLGGGLAGFFVLGADKLINTISGKENELPAKTITEQPVIKALFSKNSGKLSQSTEQFYNKLKELEQDHVENGKKGVVGKDLQKYRKANTDLQENYKLVKTVLADKRLDADAKRSKIDDLQVKHNKVILKVLGK